MKNEKRDFSIRTTPIYLEGLFISLAGVSDLRGIVDSLKCLGEMLDRGIMGHAWNERLVSHDGRDCIFTTDMDIDHLVARMKTLVGAGHVPVAALVSELVPSRLVGNDMEEMASRVRVGLSIPSFSKQAGLNLWFRFLTVGRPVEG